MLTKVTSEDCIQALNNLIVKHKLMIPRISSFNHFTASLFFQLFEAIFGLKLDLSSPDSEVKQLSSLIKAISKNILGINMEHIKAEELLKKDKQTIFNLIEIFQASAQLLLPPQTKKESETKQTQTEFSKSSSSSSSSSFISSFSSSSTLSLLSSLSSLSSCSCSSTSLSNSDSDSSCSSKAKKRSLSAEHKTKITTIPRNLETLPKKYFKQVQVDKGQSKPCFKPEITNLAKANFEREINQQLSKAFKLKEEAKKSESKSKKDKAKPNKKIVTKPAANVVRVTRLNNKKLKQKPNSTSYKKLSQPKAVISPECGHLYSDLSKQTFKKLEKQKEQQERLLKKLYQEVQTKHSKSTNQMLDELKRQEKYLESLRKDLKHLQLIENSRTQKMERIKSQSMKRDSRMEQARLYNLAKEYEKDLLSKFREAHDKEEKMIRENLELGIRQTRDDIIDLKQKIREDLEDDNRKRELLLESFRNLYKYQLNAIKAKIDEEENFIQHRLKCFLLKPLNEIKSSAEQEFS